MVEFEELLGVKILDLYRERLVCEGFILVFFFRERWVRFWLLKYGFWSRLWSYT